MITVHAGTRWGELKMMSPLLSLFLRQTSSPYALYTGSMFQFMEWGYCSAHTLHDGLM